MATNPMQRKARNSFLLGMLLMLVITGAIIALLIMQLTNMKKEEQEEKAAQVTVYTLNQRVTSGQVITQDMLVKHEVNKDMVPANATSNLTNFGNYFLQDEAGNPVITKNENDQSTLYLQVGDQEYELHKNEELGGYYIERQNNQQTEVKLVETPWIAKVDMEANTVLTTDLVSAGDALEDSTRTEEYNMLVLPADLETGDFIDVRLLLPSGTNYIVVSKKEVEIPVISGIDSTDTISIKLTEEEINTISCAIVEAFKIEGAKLYVNKYTDPGTQTAALPTYPVNYEVMALIDGNPNILEEAKNGIRARYDETQQEQRNEVINPYVTTDPEEAQSTLEGNMEESITKSIETRQEYLEGLSAQAARTSTSTNTTSTTNTTNTTN